MVVEIVIAAFVVEYGRSFYYSLKEYKRSCRAGDRFCEILTESKTLVELGNNLAAESANNAELYVKIPQTWMIRLYWRLKGE
ncbi:hypothetical protein A8709_33125 [Paenibacillus pectinilyticus]|uniref:Uncharacterized protein n=1 Tax=Paenibacillus pectinilyticus TaxID=512399 RepID=A0A1C0ZX17_9BACL|nr:hypothetical protein [Paenibacillus pectinilyticus]OCT12654.1 hypothetical protein A8709_33125 [Paenibacillus pectinilyticus]